MKKILEAHLKRVEQDQTDLPTRLYPFLTGDRLEDRKVVVIEVRRSFGRPIIARRGISTAVIVDRIDARESIADVAADCDLEREEVEEAIVYARVT